MIARRRWIPLRTAWQEALYGPQGFYRSESPDDHFRTSPEASALFAAALVQLARQLGLDRIVDVGAGSERLIGDIAAVAPSMELVAVELRPRPTTLPADVQWLAEVPLGGPALLIANELLDNVPCDVVELDESGAYRIVEVDVASGAERLGDAALPDACSWLTRWWPLHEPGQRAEVGLVRDVAWARLHARNGGGVCVAADYGHLAGDRPPGGTVAAYRSGRQTAVRFDGSCDVTAHVAFDSLAAAVGGTPRRQRDVLRELFAELRVSGRRPPLRRATEDPRGYLRDLALAGQAAELTAESGLGDFYWLATPRL